MRPEIHTSHLPNLSIGGSSSATTRIIPETQQLSESIRIPGSDARLVYRSTSAKGSHATIDVRLTPSQIPSSLAKVHLVVRVAGNVFRRSFESDPDLTFTYSWDKKNVYNQKVYGLVEAGISVGYAYSGCQSPIWVSRSANLRGFDVDVSDIGGWNLDIHHHFNSEQGTRMRGFFLYSPLFSPGPFLPRPIELLLSRETKTCPHGKLLPQCVWILLLPPSIRGQSPVCKRTLRGRSRDLDPPCLV